MLREKLIAEREKERKVSGCPQRLAASCGLGASSGRLSQDSTASQGTAPALGTGHLHLKPRWEVGLQLGLAHQCPCLARQSCAGAGVNSRRRLQGGSEQWAGSSQGQISLVVPSGSYQKQPTWSLSLDHVLFGI